MLEVPLLGLGTVLRLERVAWSMVTRLRQGINEYAPLSLVHRAGGRPRAVVRGGGSEARTAGNARHDSVVRTCRQESPTRFLKAHGRDPRSNTSQNSRSN